MKLNSLEYRLNTINYDCISKLNLYKKNNRNFFSIKKLKLLTLIDSSDKLFYKKILVLFNITSNWFNKKLHVYKVINKKKKKKNNIFYQFGSTITDTTNINNIINYINNIMSFISARIDNNLKLYYFNKYVIYKFNNLNYLLGFNNSKYFNIKMEYNIVVIYNFKKLNIQNIKLKKIYEKIFFL